MEYKEIAGRMPEKVFEYFKALSDIPRGSGNTKAVSDYCADFARARGLFYRQDEADNIVIVKEASDGYETAPTVMLQGHLDMVCGKEAGVRHDFERDPIRLAADGDYICAEGTTLGGDDGIAVAYALAILDSDEIAHPRLECVFTSDEEIGMLGANALDMDGLRARYLLNLDSEEEGSFLAGCAGGVRYDVELPLLWKVAGGVPVRIQLIGLTGGHSGVDIHRGRANANLLMGRLLWELSQELPDMRLLSARGGSQDNAIPRNSELHLLVKRQDLDCLKSKVKEWEDIFCSEYRVTDPELRLLLEADEKETSLPAVIPEDMERICFFLLNTPNGVQAMSQELPELVETSLNLGILSLTETDGFSASYLVRSSSSSRKRALCQRLELFIKFSGGFFHTSGDYPEWEFRPESPLRRLLCRVYKEQYGKEARVETIHAGVECGLFFAGIPGIDAVSMGPDILDIHTPKERLSISSVDRVWKFLIEVLKQMKDA